MKIVIAPNAFKGSLSAREAAVAMAAGARSAAPGCETVLRPVSDGGDGLLEVLARPLRLKLCTARVSDPLGRPIEALFGRAAMGATAVIEMARASGLVLLQVHERDPMAASTRGTGELMAAALDGGAKRLIVGIGGSATCDGGAGMAEALGYRFLDREGRMVRPAGGNLGKIARIERGCLHPVLDAASVEVICDVSNPLLGPDGAARVYGPQKGAGPEQVEALEAGLAHLAQLWKRDLGVEIGSLSGGGAAGGIGAGLAAFLKATLRPGVAFVLDLVGMAEAMRGADLVLTGEGRLDAQTLSGKAPAGVADLARRLGVPCLAVAGSVNAGGAANANAAAERSALERWGFTRVHALCRGGITPEEAMARAAPLVEACTRDAVRTFLAGRKKMNP